MRLSAALTAVSAGSVTLRGSVTDVRVAETIGRLNEQRADFGNDAFGVAASVGAGVGGDFDGVLRALAAIDREAQREPVIALRDRLFGTFERIGGGVELGGGVLRGAGGFSGRRSRLAPGSFLCWEARRRRSTSRKTASKGQRQQAAHEVSIERQEC